MDTKAEATDNLTAPTNEAAPTKREQEAVSALRRLLAVSREAGAWCANAECGCEFAQAVRAAEIVCGPRGAGFQDEMAMRDLIASGGLPEAVVGCAVCGQPVGQHCDLDEPGLDHPAGVRKDAPSVSREGWSAMSEWFNRDQVEAMEEAERRARTPRFEAQSPEASKALGADRGSLVSEVESKNDPTDPDRPSLPAPEGAK